MNPNLKEVRVRCAKLTGWREFPAPDLTGCFWNPDKGMTIQDWVKFAFLPHFETDLNAAMELVEHMQKTERWWIAFVKGPTGDWTAQFTSQQDTFTAEAPTLALAICMAFLKAQPGETI